MIQQGIGMKVIVILPAYNECRGIGTMVRSACVLVEEVIVVDDGSQDETAVVANHAGARVLQHRLNLGQGAALRTGTEAALQLDADVVIHMDADGQHDSSCLPSLLEPIQRGVADVVFGSRFLGDAPGIPWTRRALLEGARLFNVLGLGIPRRVTDPQSGLRAMTRDAALKISFKQDRMAHCSEILRLVTRSNLRWVEVPVSVRYTDESLSKGQTSMDAFKIAWQLFLGVFAK